jgi:phosphatidylethanolamine-binding protein (PEBP) family uncharacterized protein
MKLSGRTQMRVAGRTFTAAILAVGLVLAGCGGSSTHSSPPTETSAGQARSPSTATGTSHSSEPPAPDTTIEVKIPGLLKEDFIPEPYTCDGTNTSLPVQWSKIPAGTAELAMFLVNLKPIHGKLFFDWAVAGLSPTSHGVPAGTLPSGTVVGRNSFGNASYSICPPKGTVEEHFILRLLALPHPVAAKPGFDPETLYKETEQSVKVVGLAGGVYTRR